MKHPRGTMTVRVGAFELSRRGVARFDWRDPYYLAITLPWAGFALLVVTVEILINLLFALLYMVQPGCIINARPGSFTDHFFFSLETLATVGYGVMAPHTLYGHTVSAIEIMCGMAFTALVTGLFFVRFSKTRAKILYADDAVITRHNGRPTLMIRIANGRKSLMTHANASLGVLLGDYSAEGQFYRRVYDLKLHRDAIPIFPLTWTLMHDIDETSPLHGFDGAALKQRDARFFLSVRANDLSFGAAVQDMKDYDAKRIRFGMRFADAVTIDEHGNSLADYTRLSLLEPDGP